MRIAEKIVYLGAFAAALLLLGSCSVYKKYETPDYAKLDSIKTVSWRQFFPDTKLQALIDTALIHNADLRSAAAKVNAAKDAARASKLAFLPGLNIGPSGNYTYSRERYQGNAYAYSAPLTASWELDLSGKLLNNKRIAQASLLQSEVYVRTIKTGIVAGMAELYYTLLELDAQLEVSRTTAASWEENVRTMKAMKKAGMANEASVAHSEANACAVEASLYDLEYRINQIQNQICVLAGIPLQKIDRCSLKESVLGSNLPTSIEMKMLGARPDLQYAELEMRKAFYNTALAHAQFYPSITISGEFGWEKALTSPAGILGSVAGSLLQPLFAKGKLKAGLSAAQTRQLEAEENFRKLLIKASSEVNDAICLIKSTSSKEDIRQRQIESLANAEQSTRQLMRHSQATYLEVLSAQQSLLSARLQQISDRFDALTGSISLYKAVGGGCD